MIVKCEAVYFPITEVHADYCPVIEVQKENGKFNLDGKEIIGYRTETSEKSGLTLVWYFPESKQNMISTLEKTKWKYDDMCDIPCSYFDTCADSYSVNSFYENGEEIDFDDYKEIDFDGDCYLELVYLEVDNSLDCITFFNGDENQVVVNPNDFSSYNEFILKVKELCNIS